MSEHAAARTAGDDYWPAIDGLRAVAIILVVGYHASFPALTGGFIGVDVFFVLSGYLITGLLARELHLTGTIDLLDFYARRVRRLLPALVLVLLGTLVLGAILLSPVGEQPDLAFSAIAAVVFCANLLFWIKQSNYFSGASEEMPLLHLWTLSVEEQFYVVWPLLILAVVALARRGADPLRMIVKVLVVLSVASFAASVIVMPSEPTSAFYLMHYRAWEFGVGALLALVPLARFSTPEWQLRGSLLAIAGLAIIVGCCVTMNHSSVFPGIGAVLPVLGTAAVIAGVRIAPAGRAARTLAASPMVVLGKLSYSWYLWHWPLLAIARVNGMGELSVWSGAVLVTIALGLSALTYYFVEEPVRRWKPGPFSAPRSSVTAGGCMISGIMCVALLWVTVLDWRSSRDATLSAVTTGLRTTFDVAEGCAIHGFRFHGLVPEEMCTIGGSSGDPLIMLWGDSLAGHTRPGLSEWGKSNSVRVLSRDFGGCKPYFSTVPAGAAPVVRSAALNCMGFNEAIRASLADPRGPKPSVVVLAARWSIPSQIQMTVEGWESELLALARQIRALGPQVVLVAETPQHGRSVPTCIGSRGAEACALSRRDVDERRSGALAALNKIAAQVSGVTVLDPIEGLCTSTACSVMRDGQLLYTDAIHLSVTASTSLKPLFDRHLLPIVRQARTRLTSN